MKTANILLYDGTIKKVKISKTFKIHRYLFFVHKVRNVYDVSEWTTGKRVASRIRRLKDARVDAAITVFKFRYQFRKEMERIIMPINKVEDFYKPGVRADKQPEKTL